MNKYFDGKIRPVIKDKDKDLPVFSHSKLESFENCPMKYNLHYIEKKTSDDTTISLTLGSLLHRILEGKGKMLTTNDGLVDYDELENGLYKGYPKEGIAGIDELKKRYWEIWGVKDTEGRDYNDKLENFKTILKTEMEDDEEWKPCLFEHYFEFVYDDRIILHGYIDRIDRNKNGEFRTIDYKTSKKIYDRSKISTSQQFAIYAMAMLLEFGQLPVENMYRFICIGETQKALTLGWEGRFIKKLDKVLNKINQMQKEGIYPPSPTPLCAWCSYSTTNPDAAKYKNECEYHSNWKPNDRKNFSVNKTWDPEEFKKPKRKLVF